MRIETPSTETLAETAYLVDDYDLASRLSFFLWSSPPDDALLVAAKRGQLNDPHVLVEQTHRMLADPRVEDGLVKEFFAQWLQLNQIETHQVSDEVFPEFDRELRESMRNEACALLSNMIREDRPLTDLVDTDFTFLDARLAHHYALGRGLRPGDECTIRDAVAAARANKYRFSSLVTVIVRSFSFRYRMDPPF